MRLVGLILLLILLFPSLIFAQNQSGECSLDQLIDSLKPVIDIDFTNQIKRISSCIPFPMEVGDSKVVDREHHQSATNVKQKYIISRTGKKNYQVELNLNFKSSIPGQDQVFMKKTKECMDLYNPNLKGPSGEKLTFIFSAKAPQSTIEISDDEKHRSNSEKWNKNIKCPVILHELMHLLGLVDEYEEESNDFSSKFECRVRGSAFSVMNNQQVTIEGVEVGFLDSLLLPHHFYSIIAGDCIEGNSLYAKCAKRAYESGQSFFHKACGGDEKFLNDCESLFGAGGESIENLKRAFLGMNKKTVGMEWKKNDWILQNIRLDLVKKMPREEASEFFVYALEKESNNDSEMLDQSIMAVRKYIKDGTLSKESEVTQKAFRVLYKIFMRKPDFYRARVTDLFEMGLKDNLVSNSSEFKLYHKSFPFLLKSH